MKTSEERGKEIAEEVKQLLDNGDIEMAEVDFDTPLKVLKAVAVTDKGRKFLNRE